MIWTFAGALAIADPLWHEFGNLYPVSTIQSVYFAIGLIGCVALWTIPRLSWRGSMGGAMVAAIVFAIAAWRIDAQWRAFWATSLGAAWADGVRAQVAHNYSALVRAAFISAIGVGLIRWRAAAAPGTAAAPGATGSVAIIRSPVVFAGLAGACWILAANVGLGIGALFARRFNDHQWWALSGFPTTRSNQTFVVSGAVLAILAANWLWNIRARWTAALWAILAGGAIAFVASAPETARYSLTDAIGFFATVMCWGVALGVILPLLCAPAAPARVNSAERNAFLVMGVLSVPAVAGTLIAALTGGLGNSAGWFFAASFFAPFVAAGAVVAALIAAMLPRVRGIRKVQVLAIAAWDVSAGFHLAVVLRRVFSD